MRAPRGGRSSTAVETGRDVAVEALVFLGADAARLERFLAMTGLGLHNLRPVAADPAFLVSVLDYLLADERLLIAFAGKSGRRPEEVVRASEALGGRQPGSDP